MWTKLHQKIFEDLILDLNSIKLNYFVLRNYEMLPEINISKDVDIIIDPGKIKQVENIFIEVLKRNKIQFFRNVDYEKVKCCYGADLKKNFSIHIDFIQGYRSKGFEIFSFEELYKNTIQHKNFRVLNETYNAVMLLYYKLVSSRFLEEKYRRKISNIYKNRANEINLLIARTLPRKLCYKTIKLLENNDFESLEKLSNQISFYSKLIVIRKKPLKTIFGICNFLFKKLYRVVVFPKKIQNFISIQGPDGTGKTTFVNGLIKEIEYYFVSDKNFCKIYHHRPSILPNLGFLGEKVKIKKQDKNFTNPHRSKPSGFVFSFLRMIYYWLDYLIGIPLLLRRDLWFDKFIIYDRYIFDFIVDPYRSRIKLPHFVRKLFAFTVKQPRIVFILSTNAEIIYKRKQELSINEIQRQLNEYSKIAINKKRFVIINASDSPNVMVQNGLSFILEKFYYKIY